MNSNDNRKDYFCNTFISLLEKGLEVDVPVFGISMFPLYLPGDEVRIKKIDPLFLRVGDVVVFKGQDKLILHRLVEFDLEKEMAVTKGDGLKKSDESVSLNIIKGVVIKHSRGRHQIKWTEYAFVKKMMVVITPLTGYCNFYLARLGLKVKEVVRLLG